MTTANPGERGDANANAPNEPQPGRRPADTFGNRLVLAIRLTGLTIKEFAEQAALDDASVSNWTRGMRPRDAVAVCQAISDAHDIEFDWLLLGGPLLPARGRPVRKASDITGTYRRLPVRPQDTRPSGRPRKVVAAPPTSPAQPTRPRRVIDRSQPVAV
jgi:transcriptional regulator with XRE-family HTH domain